MSVRHPDTLQRFVFEHLPVRGMVVHLDAAWRAVLERRDYPAPVRDLLGELMAAASLLAATIKFEGRLTIQAKGHGPVRLLVVECTSRQTLRAIAQWQGEIRPAPLAELLGDSRLAITIEPEEGARYQGIVEIDAPTFGEALEHYFERSEQLTTRVWLATDPARAAGMLLQQLPGQPWQDSDDWVRLTHLGSTLSRQELLELPVRTLLHRLFNEDDIRLFDGQPVSFRCSCTRPRVESALRMLGLAEVRSILAERGKVEVDCEFCGQHYELDQIDAEQLFVASAVAGTPATRH
jgi:molecular chaperone Hsp33